MRAYFKGSGVRLNNNKFSWLDQYLPDALLIFFVLQQFGFSYHFSFGSVGLVLMAYLVRNDLSISFLKTPVLLTPLVLFSFVWVLARYGYDEKLLSLFPISISIFFLYAILRYEMAIKLPSANALIGVTVIICSVAWYQIIVDRTFQVPEYFFAMGSNISFTEDSDIYDLYKYSLRTNGIYSEPSYLGMVLCCLYLLLFSSDAKYRIPVMLFVVITQIVVGSGLGIVGMILLTFVLMRRMSFRYWLPFVLVSIAIMWLLIGGVLSGYDFAFGNRLASAGVAGDSSGVVRFLSPFLLIYENFINFDWFGVPSNFYSHYMYTNLYGSMSDFPGHNGILGLLIQFGLFGILMLVVLSKRLKSQVEWVVVLIIGSQNGSFLTYEKVFSLIFVILALRSWQTNLIASKRNVRSATYTSNS